MHSFIVRWSQSMALSLAFLCRISYGWVDPSVPSTVRLPAATSLWADGEQSSQPRPQSSQPPRPPRMLNRPLRRRPSRSDDATKDESIAIERHAAALEDPTLLSKIPFGDVGIPPSIMRSLNEMGLKKMTEIQARCYAPALDGQNLVGQSRTGSGNMHETRRSLKKDLTRCFIFRENPCIFVTPSFADCFESVLHSCSYRCTDQRTGLTDCH